MDPRRPSPGGPRGPGGPGGPTMKLRTSGPVGRKLREWSSGLGGGEWELRGLVSQSLNSPEQDMNSKALAFSD